MKHRLIVIAVAVVFGLALGGVALATGPDDVTNFTGVHISGAHATATPVFSVNGTGYGRLTQWSQNSTPVASVDSAGLGTFTDVTVSDDLGVTGDTTLGGVLISGDVTITATNGMTLTPAYSVYNLDSATAVTITVNACTAAMEGQFVWFVGDDANNIVIADSNIRTTDGNAITIGQYDLTGFICIDTEWIEIVKSADS